MKKRKIQRGGFTLVEVIIASAIVVFAVAVVSTEMVRSYRVFMFSRAKMESQGIAFDTLWDYFYRDFTTQLRNNRVIESATPEYCMFSTNGLIRTGIVNYGDYSDIEVQVWPSPAYTLTGNPGSSFKVRRYNNERRRK